MVRTYREIIIEDCVSAREGTRVTRSRRNVRGYTEAYNTRTIASLHTSTASLIKSLYSIYHGLIQLVEKPCRAVKAIAFADSSPTRVHADINYSDSASAYYLHSIEKACVFKRDSPERCSSRGSSQTTGEIIDLHGCFKARAIPRSVIITVINFSRVLWNE